MLMKLVMLLLFHVVTAVILFPNPLETVLFQGNNGVIEKYKKLL